MSTRSAVLTVNGELAYDVRGSGPGLLLLHPTGYDRRVWDRTAELLAERFRCVSPDERGWGQSEGQPGQCDRLADARSVLADAAITPKMVAAAGGAVDIAVGLALGMPDIGGIVLINPRPRELFDDTDPHFLGSVIEQAREAALGEMIAQVEGAASAAAVNERLQAHVTDAVAGAGGDPDAERLLEKILATTTSRAQYPQPALPIAIIDQLDKLTARVLLVEVAGPGSVPDGTGGLARAALVAVCDALSLRLRVVHRQEVDSSWSDLLPLGNPSLTATIISDFADEIDL